MNAGWIKLSAVEAAQLTALSQSNATNNFIIPRADASGELWLSGDCVSEANGVFLHYRSLLLQLTVTQQQEPVWPADNA